MLFKAKMFYACYSKARMARAFQSKNIMLLSKLKYSAAAIVRMYHSCQNKNTILLSKPKYPAGAKNSINFLSFYARRNYSF